MTLIANSRRIVIATTVNMPADLIIRARELGLNRTAIYREALAAKIAEIDGKAEPPKIGVRRGPTTPNTEAL